MEKVKILIVEDELIIAEDIRMQLIKLGYEVSGMAVSYNEALTTMMGNLPDLVLVDINIEGSKDGIELGHFLKNEVDIPFIYLTSNADKATVDRAKETQPDAYLLKPFKSSNLYTAIEIAISNAIQANASNNYLKSIEEDENQDYILKDCVFLKKDTTFFKIKLNDILYVRSEGNYLDLFSADGKKHFIRSSMTHFSKFLKDEFFFQTHQSYIVNLNYLDAFTNTHLKIKDEEIPLSKSRKDEFLSKMRTF
jgi:DNA-binding LytR/AlgR family response regulator